MTFANVQRTMRPYVYDELPGIKFHNGSLWPTIGSFHLLYMSVLHKSVESIFNNCKIVEAECNILIKLLTINYFYLIESVLEGFVLFLFPGLITKGDSPERRGGVLRADADSPGRVTPVYTAHMDSDSHCRIFVHIPIHIHHLYLECYTQCPSLNHSLVSWRLVITQIVKA